MRRNDVVFCHSGATRDPPHFSPYGRIVKRVGDKFEVIFCNGERWTLAEDDLTIHYYGGRIDTKTNWHPTKIRPLKEWQIVVRFPTLRKLKAIAARYERAYGKKNMFDE
jgi:hypothetical protein